VWVDYEGLLCLGTPLCFAAQMLIDSQTPNSLPDDPESDSGCGRQVVPMPHTILLAASDPRSQSALNLSNLLIFLSHEKIIRIKCDLY
jgi:hypothetical protein